MSTVSFYPGPSRVFSRVNEYIYDAYREGFLSINHRSEEFMELMAKTKEQLHFKLQIPHDFEIVFLSSATECWEVIAQSLVEHESQHFFNGAFGKKWSTYTSRITGRVDEAQFGIEEILPITKSSTSADLMCITQNETSNGTAVDHEILKGFREHNDDKLIAVDATSSMAGIKLNFELGDIWFASVQKCFGLPAGLGIMILSPKAVQKAFKIGESNHYNSLTFVLENNRNNQTHYTPNVLNIYLLYRTLSEGKVIDQTHKKIISRYNNWEKFIDDDKNLSWLINNGDVRSMTVLALKHSNPEKLKKQAKSAQIILGNGYGKWKESTIRIANFPAIKGKEIERLTRFLSKLSY